MNRHTSKIIAAVILVPVVLAAGAAAALIALHRVFTDADRDSEDLWDDIDWWDTTIGDLEETPDWREWR